MHIPKRYFPLATSSNFSHPLACTALIPASPSCLIYTGEKHALNFNGQYSWFTVVIRLTCCSIRQLRGLIITPTAVSLSAKGARNMHNDFPAPVAMRTRTSLPCMTANSASNCPGRKVVYLKYFSKAASNFSFAKHCVLPLCQFPSVVKHALPHTLI